MKKLLIFSLIVWQSVVLQAQEYTIQGSCGSTFTNLQGGVYDGSVENLPLAFFSEFFAYAIINYTNPTGGNIIIDFETFNIPVSEQNNTAFEITDNLNGMGNTVFSNTLGGSTTVTQVVINASTASILYVPVNPSSLLNPANQIRFTVTCESPITCAQPTNLVVNNLTTTSFDASWEVVGNATAGYEYVLMNANEAPNAATAVSNGTAATTQQSFSGLTPGTDYTLYIRANCGATDGLSTWLSKSFNVPSQILQPPFSTSSWTEIVKYEVNGVVTYSISSSSGSSNFSLNGSGASSTETVAVSPAIQIASNTTSGKLKFSPALFPNAVATELQVRISTQTRNLEDFTITHHSQILTEFTTPAEIPDLNLANYAGQTIYVGYFLKKPIQSITDGMALINTGSLISSCPSFKDFGVFSNGFSFVNKNLFLNDRNTTTATISWQVPYLEASTLFEYQYILMPFGEALNVENAIAVGITTDTSFQFTGLAQNTRYDAYVRTTCDGGNQFFGNTTNRLTFATLPEILVTCSETLTSPIYNSIANYLANDETITFTAAETGKMLKVFFEGGSNVFAPINVSFLNGSDNSAPTLANITANGNPSSLGTFYANNPTATLSIRTQNPNIWTSGDINGYKLQVSCYDCSETPSNLVVHNITDVSAQVMWDAPEVTLNGYDVMVMPQGEAPNEATAAFFGNVTINGASISNLTQNTAYTVYVRVNCQPNLANSAWVSANFTTKLAGDTCEFPIVINTLPYTNSNNTALFSSNYDNTNVPLFTTQSVLLTDEQKSFLDGKDVVYQITPDEMSGGFYNIQLNNVNPNTGLFVLEGCPDFLQLIAFDTNAQAGNKSLNQLYLQAGIPYLIVVSGNDVNQTTTFDLVVERFNCVALPGVNLVSTTATTANVAWEYDSLIDSVSYELYLAGENPAIEPALQTGTLSFGFTNLNLTNLTGLTDYTIYFSTDCSGDNISPVVAFNFSTPAYPLPEVTLSESGPFLIDVNTLPYTINSDQIPHTVVDASGSVTNSFSSQISCVNGSFLGSAATIGNNAEDFLGSGNTYQSFQAPSDGFITHLTVLLNNMYPDATAVFEIYKNEFVSSAEGTGIIKIGEVTITVDSYEYEPVTNKLNQPIYVESGKMYLLKQISGPSVLKGDNSDYMPGESLNIANEMAHFINPAASGIAPDWMFKLRFFDVSALTPQNIDFEVTNISGTTSTPIQVFAFTTTALEAIGQNITATLNASGVATVNPADAELNSTVLCEGSFTSHLSQTEFYCTELGDNLVLYSIKDVYGNENFTNITVTITDNIPLSIINVPTEIKAYTLNSTGANITYSLPMAEDNCINEGNPIDLNQYPPTPDGFTKIGIYNGHTYFISNDTKGFFEFTNELEFIPDAKPVKISTAGENEFLTNYLNTNGNLSALIGYYDVLNESSFRWYGDPFLPELPVLPVLPALGGGLPVKIPTLPEIYTNWSIGQPDDANGGEDVVEMNAAGDGKWRDIPLATNTLKMIIEIPYAIVQTAGIASGELFPIGITTNTFIAYDKSGNTTEFSFDVNVEQVAEPLITSIWTGNSGTDWNTVANWNNGIPTPTMNAIIPEVTNAPIISSTSNAATKDLTIIESDGLIIKSGGILIVRGTSSGMVTYERDLPTNNWYSIASPVFGQAYGDDFVTANELAFGVANPNNRAIGIYNITSDDWTYLQAGGNGTFNPGQGYAIKRKTLGIISFKGTINVTDMPVTLTVGGRGNYNFIGNPFTSYVNSTNFAISNSDKLLQKSIWVWNQQNETYNVIPTDLENFMIAPTQGFFVRGNSINNLLFSKANQSTSPTATFQKNSNTVVKLNLTDGTNNRYAKVYYVAEATTGFDNGYDGELFGGNINEMSLFTILLSENDGKKYQVQAIPNTNFENSVIPVGVEATAGKELTFSVEAQNVPEGFSVYLEDKETKTVAKLSNENSFYKVLLTNALDGTGRFYLHTKSSNVLNTIDSEIDPISIFKMENNKLKIIGLNQEKANVKLFNILGKKVFETPFTASGSDEIQLPLTASGIYIVKLNSERGLLTKKIKLD